MDYSEPLTRLEKLPSLISDCFRKGDKESAYLYLEEVKERVSELQAWVRQEGYMPPEERAAYARNLQNLLNGRPTPEIGRGGNLANWFQNYFEERN